MKGKLYRKSYDEWNEMSIPERHKKLKEFQNKYPEMFSPERLNPPGLKFISYN